VQQEDYILNKNFKDMDLHLRLGDKAEALINATVPKAIIDHVKKQDGGCGCNKRKEILNNLDNLFK